MNSFEFPKCPQCQCQYHLIQDEGKIKCPSCNNNYIEPMNTPRIRNRIKEYRIKAGLTQKEVSEPLKVNRSAIAQWEAGSNPEYYRWIPLAEILKVEWEVLFYLQ